MIVRTYLEIKILVFFNRKSGLAGLGAIGLGDGWG